MHEERSNLLAQVPLTVSPFINLPKPPTLPHNYTSLPSTLPPSILSTQPSQSSGPSPQQAGTPDLPAYVTSAQSTFSAHPSTIAAQNQALLERLNKAPEEGRRKFEEWEKSIEDRELQEKRRRAPGWLDRDEKILSPERAAAGAATDAEVSGPQESAIGTNTRHTVRQSEGGGKDQGGELGEMMDRAFGGMG